MKIKICAFAFTMGIMLSSGAVHAETQQNIQIMIDAARQPTWDDWVGNNPAQFLVKQEAIVTPVAVIFGYVDNAVAYDALARALSQPQTFPGTFRCQPIF